MLNQFNLVTSVKLNKILCKGHVQKLRTKVINIAKLVKD